MTDDPALLERVRILQDHGRRPGDTNFFNHEVGFKYKMSALQAAIGLAQVERVEELIARKREIFRWYHDALSPLPLILNAEPSGILNSYWMVTAVFPEDFPRRKWRSPVSCPCLALARGLSSTRSLRFQRSGIILRRSLATRIIRSAMRYPRGLSTFPGGADAQSRDGEALRAAVCL